MTGRSRKSRAAIEVVEGGIPLEVTLHDLANELLTVKVQLEFLKDTRCDACQARDGGPLETARASLDAGLDLVERLKHPTRGELEIVSILERVAWLEEAKPELERRYGLTLEISRHVSKDCAVYSSFEMAAEITRQLIENASRAGARSMRVHYQEFAETVEAVFVDDGEGMTPEEIETLGVIAPHDRPSGGLGVQMVRDLVRRSNGRVLWSSRKNVGTWVTIRLRKVVR